MECPVSRRRAGPAARGGVALLETQRSTVQYNTVLDSTCLRRPPTSVWLLASRGAPAPPGPAIPNTTNFTRQEEGHGRLEEKKVIKPCPEKS